MSAVNLDDFVKSFAERVDGVVDGLLGKCVPLVNKDVLELCHRANSSTLVNFLFEG